MLKLQDFVDHVEDYEKNCRKYAENAFWRAHEELGGNFLAHPLAESVIKPIIHKFLGLWRSYRHHIDWKKLAETWTADVQNIAASLTDVRLEFADDLALAKADNLYLHLLSSNIEGMGHTNISKVLALSLTNLCVMWDSGAKREFMRNHPPAPRIRQTHGDYYRFLRHRRQVATDLITQVVEKQRINTFEAVDWLRKIPLRIGYGREKPLAKLLDEYYYGRSRTGNAN